MDADISKQDIYNWLSVVSDPEVPVLTILDLGIVRDVQIMQYANKEFEVTIKITSTYSGCPAMDVIAMNIRMVLMSHGIKYINIKSDQSCLDYRLDER